jgi:hypothetical protein
MRYEYDIFEVDLPSELLNDLSRAIYGDPLSSDSRRKINNLVKDKLNELGKQGWKWHESGLNTLPTFIVYREKKGANNVRSRKT